MRILHVLNHTGRLNGNVHAAIDLACAQAGLGHAVALCSRGGDFDAVLAESGVTIMRVDQSRRPATLIKAMASIGRLIRDWRADIVHAHMMTSAALAYPGCKLRGRPLITTVHNAFEKSAVVMGLGDRVIAVSDAVARSMRKRGISASRLRVVLNGTIGSARLPPPPPPAKLLARPSIVFVGGLHPRKGVADLLQAFDQVYRSMPAAHLYLVGEGPFESAYRAAAAARESSGAVTFCGRELDPRSYMLGSDIVVLPSLADPAPLVLSEAREAGCAIVASAVDGIPELLEHGAAGQLVPPGDPDRLAATLLALASDPRELALWRARSQINIAHMSVGRVAADTLAVYEECLGRRARMSPEMPDMATQQTV